jgi:hypothetical protein
MWREGNRTVPLPLRDPEHGVSWRIFLCPGVAGHGIGVAHAHTSEANIMLEAVARALQFATAATSIILGLRNRKYRPVAWFLVGTTLADLARSGLERTGVFDVPGPYTGFANVIGQTEKALFLTWDAGLAALVMSLCLKRRPWGVLLAWLVAVAILILAYPWLRAERLQSFYLGADILTLMASIAFIVLWLKRDASEKRPGGEFACLFVLLCVEAGRTLAYVRADIFASWERAVSMYCGLYGTLLLVQGGMIWTGSRTDSR